MTELIHAKLDRPGIIGWLVSHFLNILPAAIALGVLFLPPFFHDVPLPEGQLLVWRDSVSGSFNASSQFLWWWILMVYILFFSLWNLRTFRPRELVFSKIRKPEPRDAAWITSLLLLGFASIISIRYWLDYEQIARTTDSLVLLFGVLLHQGLMWLVARRTAPQADRLRNCLMNGFVLSSFLCLLLTPLKPGREILYHGQLRWSGIYSSSNEFGLLMAVTFMLVVARAWSYARTRRLGLTVFYILPFAASALCVMRSYSRGAWTSLLAGFLFLGWNRLRRIYLEVSNPVPSPVAVNSQWARKVMVWGVAGILIGFCLSCGVKKALKSNLAGMQRIFSPFNEADFSSRNRIASYQDGINMLMDKPLTGYGGRNIVAVHDDLYLQSGLSDGEAIVLNDFLMLALRFGIPTIALFSLFIWISLSMRSSGWRRYESDGNEWNNNIMWCRMATLMLAVGFVFSGGIFRLAPGGAFWLFLMLSMELEAIAIPDK